MECALIISVILITWWITLPRVEIYLDYDIMVYDIIDYDIIVCDII